MKTAATIIGLVILILIPVAGGLCTDINIIDMINFKLGSKINGNPFNWAWFISLAILGIAVITILINNTQKERIHLVPIFPIKLAGRLWIVTLGVVWALYWLEIKEMYYFNLIGFPALWISFIMAIGYTTKRYKEQSEILNWRNFLILSVFSAVFWWYFEFLNQFTGNWNYNTDDRIADLSIMRGIVSSIAFATVLLGEIAILELFCCASGFIGKLKITQNKIPLAVSGIMITLGTAMLFLMPIFPNEMFPALWLAPILIIIGVQGVFFGHFKSMTFGDTSLTFMISASSLSSLICGFFWEMWNYYNSGGWSYTLPYVDKFDIFEMPVLGYLGYLPFGVESMLFCALIFSLRK